MKKFYGARREPRHAPTSKEIAIAVNGIRLSESIRTAFEKLPELCAEGIACPHAADFVFRLAIFLEGRDGFFERDINYLNRLSQTLDHIRRNVPLEEGEGQILQRNGLQPLKIIGEKLLASAKQQKAFACESDVDRNAQQDMEASSAIDCAISEGILDLVKLLDFSLSAERAGSGEFIRPATGFRLH